MKSKTIFIAIILALVAFLGVLKNIVCVAEEPCPVTKDSQPVILCYRAAVIDTKDKNFLDLKRQLKFLEQSYKQKKINEETYEARKKVILDQLEDLAKE